MRLRGVARRSSSIDSWAFVACLGFALLGLGSGAAHAQVVTEFSAGISALAHPFGITAGPDGNLWFTEILGNRIGRSLLPAPQKLGCVDES